MNKSVLVNGTFRSGSGAVNDYLSSRKDFTNPLGDNEFRIVSDPMGLQNLFNICYKDPGLLSSAYAFQEFQRYIFNLQKYTVYLSPGVKGKLYKKNLLNFKDEFIKKVTKLSYYAMPHYSRVNLNFRENVKYSLALKLKKENPETKLRNIIIPKEKNFFLKKAKIYIKKVIHNSTIHKIKNKNIVLNNSIDIFNSIESSKFFNNPKIIIVIRDPRDIFSSMKIGKAAAAPNYDVKIFVNWYKHFFCGNEFNKILNNKKVFTIIFENFVNNFDKENEKLCKFLGINKKFQLKNNNTFNLEISKKNVGKSKKNLSKYEIQYIEKKLSQYLKW